MSEFYKTPWAPGYALPPYLDDEDPLKKGGARTTAQLPGGTFGPVPKGLKFGNYSLPQYVKDEPIGSHARTTPQLPDGTVGPIPARVKVSGNPWSENTLQSNGLGSLGDATLSEPTLPGGDPLKEYGHEAAGIVMDAIREIDPKERGSFIRQLLGKVDPKLNSLMAREVSQAKSQGKSDAMRVGLASAFSRGMLDEFVVLGKSKKAKGAAAAAKGARNKKSQVGLGAAWGQHTNYVGMGRAAESRGLGGWTSSISGALSTTLDKLGSAACKVAGNKATPYVAGAAGAYYGGPQGASLAMAGAGIAASACAPDPDPGLFGGGFPSVGGMPSWAMPAIIVGGVLTVIFVLKR